MELVVPVWKTILRTGTREKHDFEVSFLYRPWAWERMVLDVPNAKDAGSIPDWFRTGSDLPGLV